ncbi:MAG: hypothetical protein M3Q42_13330 [Pseudomonadota bacterium]|nr:hypothetical protein [Pseudomonadota bacterium]
MAEINVERKKNVWPWIVGLIVLLLAIWAVAEIMGDDDARIRNDAALGTTATQPTETAPAAQAYEPLPETTPDTATTGDTGTTTPTTPPRQ